MATGQSSPYTAHIGDHVQVMNLDGSVAYRGRVIRVGVSVTVLADGSETSIAEHPASIRHVIRVHAP